MQKQRIGPGKNSQKSVMLLNGVELETLGEIPGMDLPLPVLIAEEFGFIARFKGFIQKITNLVSLTLL